MLRPNQQRHRNISKHRYDPSDWNEADKSRRRPIGICWWFDRSLPLVDQMGPKEDYINSTLDSRLLSSLHYYSTQISHFKLLFLPSLHCCPTYISIYSSILQYCIKVLFVTTESCCHHETLLVDCTSCRLCLRPTAWTIL